jgi:hypothetical protein
MEIVRNQEVQIGEIIVGSWGYEARYPEFYQVIKMVNGWITLQKLKKVQVGLNGDPYGGGCRLMFPSTVKDGVPFRRKMKVNSLSEGFFVRISSYEYARKWDGQNEEEYNYH